MGINAYDVQVYLGKLLKFSSKICVAFLIKYPFISFPLLCLFLLYMSYPSVFWFLLYSFPLLVFTAIILRIFFSIENGNKNKEDEISANAKSAENKRSLKHARSVRRRRAQCIKVEDHNNSQCNLDEKNTVFSTSFNHDMVDKNALIEEIPREIREIEVDSSFTKGITGEGPKRVTGLQRWEEQDREENKKWNSDDQKSVMDVGIERTKRLESMIARRRARKLLSLQVRRTLMNMDRIDPTANLASLVIPKRDDTSIFSSSSGQVSPIPGSAPSIMIPMRNPFDLPYDPQEEKLDLTGDSFQQEFMSPNQNDVMFCRHESFSLGAFLQVENRQNRLEETSSFQDFGFRQKCCCSKEYQVSNLGNPFCKQKCCTCNETNKTKETESESSQVIEPESISNSADDHIKKIIQVYENGNHYQNDIDRTHEGSIPVDNSSTKTSSSSSSEENEPYFKIDKEAILKSLSSMARRNNDIEAKENTDQIGDHLNYEAYISGKNSLHDHFYYADKIVPRHTPSFSIASDMQVEVSEISSPPLTINENFSSQGEDVSTYDIDMDKEIIGVGHDSWEGLSHLSGVESESLSREVNEVSEQDITEVEISRINEYEDSPVTESMIDHGEMMNISAPPENRENLEEIQHNEGGQRFAEVSIFQVTMDSNDHQALNLMENLVVQQIPEIPSSSLSPNSVLQPTLSLDQSILSSVDHDIEEIQQSVAHNGELLSPVTSRNATPMAENSTALPQAGADFEISQEPSEASRVPTMEDEDNASVNHQETLELNGLNSNGVASGSSQILGSDEPAELLQPEETEFRSLNKNAEVLTKSIEAGHINNVNSPNPSLSTEEESTEDQEKVTKEVVKLSDSNNSRSYDDQRENSASENNTREEQRSNNFLDHIWHTGPTIQIALTRQMSI